jgi:hypothetical protein
MFDQSPAAGAILDRSSILQRFLRLAASLNMAKSAQSSLDLKLYA